MKLCLPCAAEFDCKDVACPNCGARPALIDGFEAFAPVFAREGGGFKAGYFAELARVEAQNFWFRARNDLIAWALKKYGPDCRSFLEIGCGTGFVLSGLARAFPAMRLEGSEIFVDGLAFAAARLPSAKFMQMDARQIPFSEEYDAIGAFDVLEHIKEDEDVLNQARKALKPGGLLLVSVPQHTWLWSAMDELACHERRYSAADLHRKVSAAGFDILRSTSFVSTLLPAMLISRLLKKNAPAHAVDPMAELSLPAPVNALFFSILRAELALVRQGLNFPMGGSRLVVARKL
jgi:SAM-dependent methyltransferase